MKQACEKQASSSSFLKHHHHPQQQPQCQHSNENNKNRSYNSYYASVLANGPSSSMSNNRSVLLMATSALPSGSSGNSNSNTNNNTNITNTNAHNVNGNATNNNEGRSNNRGREAAKQLFCGGLAGAVGKTITAPFSRLTILFQVHSMVTTREHRPKFAMSLFGGMQKIIDRGGVRSLWKGNLTSVLHRFPYSAINFFMYEATLDLLRDGDSSSPSSSSSAADEEEGVETEVQFVRRLTAGSTTGAATTTNENKKQQVLTKRSSKILDQHISSNTTTTKAGHKFLAGAVAGSTACIACYPLDLVRTRLTTQLEGKEHYRGILDSISKIARTEGFTGFFSGIGPTLLVAVPNFAISYTVYGTLKEYTLDDDLFYNLRRIDAESGEAKMGMVLTVLCGAASGTLATCTTFPMDTIRRRMQIQSLHTPNPAERLNSYQLFHRLVTQEGLRSVYRGLTPELIKVMPMVGSMFLVYEFTKEKLKV